MTKSSKKLTAFGIALALAILIGGFLLHTWGWTYSRIWTCCYSYRVIKYYSVNSRVSEISPEPFLHAIIMKMSVSGAKTVPKRKTPSNFAIQRSFFLTIP